MRKVHYSFCRGYKNLKKRDIPAARAELMAVLGLKYECSFYAKKKNIVNIPAYMKDEIERIFEKYGVKPCDIWDITY